MTDRTKPHAYVPRADEELRTCAVCGFGRQVRIHDLDDGPNRLTPVVNGGTVRT